MLLLVYGLRRGEVLGLSWDDADLAEDVLRVGWQIQRLDGQLRRVLVKTAAGRRKPARNHWRRYSGRCMSPARRPDAGRKQYVAEQITDIAPPGTVLAQGQPVARYAKSGTAIEYGWSPLSGITLAVATTGYEEGEITPAGRSMRAWLNPLGAGAGPDT